MSMAWFLGAVAGQAAASSTSAVPGATASPAVSSLSSSALATAASVPALPLWRIALLVLIFAALLGVWFWVNRGRINLRTLLQPGTQRISIQEQRWVNGRTRICLVEVEGERFLLVQGQGSAAWQPLQPKAAPKI